MDSLASADRSLFDPVVWRPNRDQAPALSRSEMLRYLGHTGQKLDRDLDARIDRAVADVVDDARICGVRRVFAVDPHGVDQAGEPSIALAGTCVQLQGKDVYRHLKDARYCALLCCTLGMPSERRLRALGSADALAAALYDAACSAYVEDAVEVMDKEARSLAAHHGFATNWRFSCGYGDCPLDAQPAILSALNAQRLCGLTATPSNLLLPSKSVTCAIGLFEDEVHDARTRPTCGICRLRPHCSFRSRGTTCYQESGPGGRPLQ